MRSAIIAAVVAGLVAAPIGFAAGSGFIITNAHQQISGRALREIEPSVERGRRGPQGIQGYLGPFGPPGPAGPKGDKGTTGAVGNTIQGETGPQGPAGPEGKEGRKGPTGATGPDYIIAGRMCEVVKVLMEREERRIEVALKGGSEKETGPAPLGAKEEILEGWKELNGGPPPGLLGCAEVHH